jgi:hypothetical protein
LTPLSSRVTEARGDLTALRDPEAARPPTHEEMTVMAASDALEQLAAQARTAEEKYRQSTAQGRTDLEARVTAARKSVDQHADELRAKADKASGDAERNWKDLQRSWKDHIAQLHERIDEKKTERDIRKADRRAELAEEDALVAVDFAAAALEEAEYSVLDAALARMDADEVAATA